MAVSRANTSSELTNRRYRFANSGFLITGGVIAETGGYRIHTFAVAGNPTLTMNTSMAVEYLVIAGGGAGSISSAAATAGTANTGGGGGGAGATAPNTVTGGTAGGSGIVIIKWT